MGHSEYHLLLEEALTKDTDKTVLEEMATLAAEVIQTNGKMPALELMKKMRQSVPPNTESIHIVHGIVYAQVIGLLERHQEDSVVGYQLK